MNLKKKRGGLNERKIWTDIRISMNLKKKDGFWTNGRLQKNKTKKKNKKKLSPDLSESLTRFTMSHIATEKCKLMKGSIGSLLSGLYNVSFDRPEQPALLRASSAFLDQIFEQQIPPHQPVA